MSKQLKMIIKIVRMKYMRVEIAPSSLTHVYAETLSIQLKIKVAEKTETQYIYIYM